MSGARQLRRTGAASYFCISDGTAEADALTRQFLTVFLETASSAGDGPDDDERLLPRCDSIRQRGVGRLVGQIFLAGEEAQERAALLGVVVADGAAQHGIARLKCVQHRTLRDRTIDFERHLAADVGEVSEVEGEDYADHASNI